jgi:GT2 family glycosyltransferase
MLTIILPYHNRKNITLRLIACLRNQSYKNFRLILVDDGSTDGTTNEILKIFPKSVVLNGNGNLWWGGSLSLAYNFLNQESTIQDEPILILNDDVEINETFLEIGIRYLEENKLSLIMALSISKATNEINDRGVFINWRTLEFYKSLNGELINILSTRGLLLYKSTLISTGGFLPQYFPHYLSDYDFTYRAYKKGFSLKTFEDFYLTEDPNETGHRKEIYKITDIKKVYFSKKSVYYLPAWLSFIALHSPKKYLIQNFFKHLAKNFVLEIIYNFKLIKSIYIFSNICLEFFLYLLSSKKKSNEFTFNDNIVGKVEYNKIYKIPFIGYFYRIIGYSVDPEYLNEPSYKLAFLKNGNMRVKKTMKIKREDRVYYSKNPIAENTGWDTLFYVGKRPLPFYQFFSLSCNLKTAGKII